MNIVKLSEVCEFIVDCLHSTAPTQSVGLPLIRTPNIGKGRLILENVFRVSEETYKIQTQRGVPIKNDLIMAREAPAGNVAIIKNEKNVCLGQRTVHLRPNIQKINPDFLCYFLLSPKQQHALLATSSGATVPHVNMKDIRNLKLIDLPPLLIQRKIAKILSSYDDLIEKNLNQIKLLEEHANLTYEEWFLRFRIDGKKLDIDRVSGLPNNWILSPISSFTKFHCGYAFKSKDYEENKKYKIVTIKNVQNGFFVPNTTDTISSEPNNLKAYQKLSSGDYIMSLTGNVGRVCLVYGNNYLLNQRVVKLEAKKLVDYSFIYALFRHENMLTQLGNISNGAAQQNLSPVNIAKIKIPLPDEKLREKFNKKIKPTIDLIINLNLQNQLLKESRDIFLPRLMTGMIDTSKIDIAL